MVTENSILLALPVLASFNVFVRLELHGRCLCRVWLFWKIELLRLKWLACFRRTGCRSLSCCRRRTSLSCHARSCLLSALRRLAGFLLAAHCTRHSRAQDCKSKQQIFS